MSSSGAMTPGRAVCAACNRNIDAAAKLCPYCGANPATGERVDTEALLQEMFQPRTVTTSESVMEYARQRQGLVIALSAFVALLIAAAVHQYATMRNNTAVSEAPAVPLSELTDVTNKPDETTPVPMPKLDFQYDGKPQKMRTYVMEAGAVTPPEVLAAQQAEAQANAAAAAQAHPGAAVPAALAPGAARPAAPAAAPPARPAQQPR
jgi:hypothetical protein